jgi:hypothetical protein
VGPKRWRPRRRIDRGPSLVRARVLSESSGPGECAADKLSSTIVRRNLAARAPWHAHLSREACRLRRNRRNGLTTHAHLPTESIFAWTAGLHHFCSSLVCARNPNPIGLRIWRYLGASFTPRLATRLELSICVRAQCVRRSLRRHRNCFRNGYCSRDALACNFVSRPYLGAV